MEIYIGVDPSFNSTGICKLYYNNADELIKKKFYIIRPSDSKLTKREKAAADTCGDIFEYITYDKYDLSPYKEDNHMYELLKTKNACSLMESIHNIVSADISDNDKVYVLQEGISYGSSIRTKSIFDLAGLNYLLRNVFINKDRYEFTIAAPTNIKKFVTGKGNAKKTMIVDEFLSHYNKLKCIPKVDDIADAYFMAQFARHLKNEG